jgi:hypothetical protein
MVHEFKYPYRYEKKIIEDWNSKAIGVYYCGVLAPGGKLTLYYIGSAVGEDGIRGRLLDHLGEDKWHDVTHFGYHVCDTEKEALDHEASEIFKYKPKYNTQGK